MEKLQREIEKSLLDTLLRNIIPADKYAEVAGMVLRYGFVSKKLGEASMKEKFLIKIQDMIDNECDE